MLKNRRLLQESIIPKTIWNQSDGHVYLPAALIKAYSEVINERGLFHLSTNKDRLNPPTGGKSQDRTDLHFARAFDGSAARAMLALLDLEGQTTSISDDLVQFFSGGKKTLVDVPCGAGATVFAVLTLIAELREQKVLPRNPLYVDVLAADLSEPARVYAIALHEKLKGYLESQAVFVELECMDWNVLDKESTKSLIHRMITKSSSNENHLLTVSNFNGFLEQERKRSDAMPQIQEIFEYASRSDFTALWIEPRMNRAIAKGGLLEWLSEKIKSTWSKFAKHSYEGSGSSTFCQTSASFRDPLHENDVFRVNLAVLPITLEILK